MECRNDAVATNMFLITYDSIVGTCAWSVALSAGDEVTSCTVMHIVIEH